MPFYSSFETSARILRETVPLRPPLTATGGALRDWRREMDRGVIRIIGGERELSISSDKVLMAGGGRRRGGCRHENLSRKNYET